MNNPLPSGSTWSQVQPAFRTSQQLADALAAHDWPTARGLDSNLANFTDQQFLDGYQHLNRLSLLLLDAHPTANGYRLLMVHVANEFGSAQTSLYCVQWQVDTAIGNVTFVITTLPPRIGRVPAAISPEGVRNDPGLVSTVRTQCTWS